jgi:hypothetical protein
MKRLILIVTMACAFAAASAPRAAAAESKAALTKDEYVKKAHAELDELSEQIDTLEHKAKKAGASAHEGMDQTLKDLKAQRKAAKKKLSKLKKASGKAWDDLKDGMDKGLTDLRAALDKALKD